MTILNHMSYYGEEFERKVFGTDFLKKIRDNGLNERDITHAITCKKFIAKSYFRQIVQTMKVFPYISVILKLFTVSKTPREMAEALGLDTETMRPFKDFLKAVRDDNPDVLRDRLMEGGTEHLETFKRDYSGGIEKYFKEVATWMDASDDLDGMDSNKF